MVCFKPGDQMKSMFLFLPGSYTGIIGKNLSSPNRSRTYDLTITSSDDLRLSRS